jgi:ABC-type multidrug transport system ATPase subunit
MRLDAVGKRYGLRQPWVVRGVTQDVAAGKLIRVEGPNGSGKSTLLRMVAGVTMPSAGRVSGRPPTGYVPERFPGGLAFSAREYLRHMGRIHGLPDPAVPAAADELLARLGAAEYAGSPLRTLSKGMCQKIAIAQALLVRPGLLVLDEAWTGLDQAARGALDAAVTQRVAAGGTVLFVDHDQTRLAGRIDERWQLAGGRVTVRRGDATAAADAPARTDERPAGNGAVVVDVTGLEPGSLAGLMKLAGVIAVEVAEPPGGIVEPPLGIAEQPQGFAGQPRGTGEPRRAAEPRGTGEPRRTAEAPRDVGLVRLTVVASRSDDVLRALLSWDGVHVRTVHAEPEPEADR